MSTAAQAIALVQDLIIDLGSLDFCVGKALQSCWTTHGG